MDLSVAHAKFRSYAYQMSILSDAQVAAIVRGVLQLGRRLRAERPADSVPLSALAILSTLYARGPMPAARLAEAERLQPQSLTRLIHDLETRALIARAPDPADGRTLLISLTEAGRQAFHYDIAARQAWMSQAMESSLTGDEQALLLLASEVMAKLARPE